MYEHNALDYWSGLAVCLTMVRSSRARCPATALIYFFFLLSGNGEYDKEHNKRGYIKDRGRY